MPTEAWKLAGGSAEGWTTALAEEPGRHRADPSMSTPGRVKMSLRAALLRDKQRRGPLPFCAFCGSLGKHEAAGAADLRYILHSYTLANPGVSERFFE